MRRAVLARKAVQVFKSHLDARYGQLVAVRTHDGGQVASEPATSSVELVEKTMPASRDCTSSTATTFVAASTDVANALVGRGVHVILAGTAWISAGGRWGRCRRCWRLRIRWTRSTRSACAPGGWRRATSGCSTEDSRERRSSR